MGFNITQMRSELRVHLGNLSVTALPDLDADLLINRSWWQIQNSLGFEELKANRSFDTVQGTNNYPIVPAVDQEAIRQIAYNSSTNPQRIPLYPWDLSEYLVEYNPDTNFRGAPEKYIREGDNIIIWPDPDDVYTITLYYLATLSDWSDANPNITIPQAAQEIVLYGAIWRGYDRLGNLTMAQNMMQRVEDLVRVYVPPQAKEQTSQQYARLIPLRSKYP